MRNTITKALAAATAEPTVRTNEWNGYDYRTHLGVIRTTADDTDQVIYGFTPNMISVFEMRFRHAPEHIVLNALHLALQDIAFPHQLTARGNIVPAKRTTR